MPLEEPKIVNPNKVLPMSPDRFVTHVPGLDPYGAATIGSGHLRNFRTDSSGMGHTNAPSATPDCKAACFLSALICVYQRPTFLKHFSAVLPDPENYRGE